MVHRSQERVGRHLPAGLLKEEEERARMERENLEISLDGDQAENLEGEEVQSRTTRLPIRTLERVDTMACFRHTEPFRGFGQSKFGLDLYRSITCTCISS